MSLRIPNKKDLLSRYQASQKSGKALVLFETLVALLLLTNLDRAVLLARLDEVLILLSVAVLPTILSLAYYFAKKKKKVKDIKPTTRYGHLSKTEILEVCEIACNRMNINPKEVNFYITSDKQVNASALTLGLGFLLKSLNIVMLNRSTLHALKKEELLSVVAHELAHIYRYPVFFQQALLLRLFNTSVIGLFIYTIFPQMILVVIAMGAYQALLSRFFGGDSITIEFLCDDAGAEVAGVLPALRAEFLIAKHSEVLGDAFYFLLKAKRDGQNLSGKDLNALLESSLTYDCVSSEELNAQVQLNLKQHQEKQASSFFQHFKGQVFSDSLDAEDDLEDEYLKLAKIRKISVLELPSHEGELDISWFKEFVSRVKASPDVPAFRSSNDMSDDDSTHPGPRRRMLYLWEEFGGRD